MTSNDTSRQDERFLGWLRDVAREARQPYAALLVQDASPVTRVLVGQPSSAPTTALTDLLPGSPMVPTTLYATHSPSVVAARAILNAPNIHRVAFGALIGAEYGAVEALSELERALGPRNVVNLDPRRVFWATLTSADREQLGMVIALAPQVPMPPEWPPRVSVPLDPLNHEVLGITRCATAAMVRPAAKADKARVSR